MKNQYADLCSSYLTKHLENYKGIPATAWSGIIVSLIESSLIGICYFLSLFFVNELHKSVLNAGMLMSAYGIGTILGSYIGGKLSDYFPTNRVSIFSLLLQAIAFISLIQIQSTFLLVINLIIIGFASYTFIVSNHTWVLSHCNAGENQRLKAINLLGVASNMGLGIAALIISFFSTQNFIFILFISSLFLLITSCYLLHVELSDKKTSPPHAKPTKTQKNAPYNAMIWFTLSALFAAGLLISQTNTTYSIYLQTQFPERGISSYSLLFLLNTCLVVIFQTPLSNSLVKLNKALTMGAGVFLLGLGLFLLNCAYVYSLAILACIIMTLGEIIFFSISFLVCYDFGEKDRKGQAIGLYRMTYALSRVAGPFSGGFIYSNFGVLWLWNFCGILGLLYLVISCFVILMHPRKNLAISNNETLE